MSFQKCGLQYYHENTANSRQKEARCLEELLKKDIDGLIIEPSKSEMICKHRNLYQNLDKFEIPYVFIQGIYSEMKVNLIFLWMMHREAIL